MVVYPERICPVCGSAFIPNTKKQVFCKAVCRVKFNRTLKKDQVAEPPKELNWMLESIRRVDPLAALELEQVGKEIGLKYAERMITIGYRLANRGAVIVAKNILIEAGVVSPRKARQRKLAQKVE